MHTSLCTLSRCTLLLRCTLFSGLALFLTIAAPASAQVHPSQAAAARALFEEGVSLARASDYDAAIDRFRRAQALRPSGPIAFNLAAALARSGGLVEASEIFARLAHDETVTQALRDSAAAERRELEPRLAHLTLRLVGDVEGAELELDARVLPPSVVGVALPVDPGPHEVRLMRAAGELDSAHFALVEGEDHELVLGVVPTRLEAPLDSPRPPSGELAEDPPPTAGGDDGVWIGLGIGVGVVVIAGAVVLGVLLTQPQPGIVVPGNTMPAVLTW